MLQRLVLSREAHWQVKDYCESCSIGFLSTAFDFDSLKFLVEELGLPLLKISSGEVTNAPLLVAFARSGCNLIISTGMASLPEVEQALGALAWGLAHPKGVPAAPMEFELARTKPEFRQLLRERVTVLHCTSQYPAPITDINLRAMETLRQHFDISVGYSDHTLGTSVAIAAAALGATVIEKHFTLSRDMDGPDHKASLEPDELKAMVAAVREVELAFGDGDKRPRESEKNTREVARKSLVAAKHIEEGDLFSSDNLAVLRPGTGVSPIHFWNYIGKRSQKNYSEGDLIERQ